MKRINGLGLVFMVLTPSSKFKSNVLADIQDNCAPSILAGIAMYRKTAWLSRMVGDVCRREGWELGPKEGHLIGELGRLTSSLRRKGLGTNYNESQ